MDYSSAELQGRAGQGRNRDDVRQHNLSILLQSVHLAGSVTRSQLTAHTGLNRSTISDLVSELDQLGFAKESETESKSAVGRPSLVVSASDEVLAISVHPEYDFFNVGLVTLSGRVIKQVRSITPSDRSAKAMVQRIGKVIADLQKGLPSGSRIAGIGVAVPGQVRVSDGVVRLAPHLGWREEPIAQMFTQATGLPTFIDNDASLGCLAERAFGAAHGYADVVYVYAGSGGIGGGAIVGGRQLRGTAGYGGEFGHTRVSNIATVDYSGFAGTLEAAVRRDDVLDALKMYSATDEELEREILTHATPQVKKLLKKQISALAIGLSNFINIFNPEAVVLGGFLATLLKYDAESLIAEVKKLTIEASWERVVFLPGALGENLLMFGAAERAFAPLLARPSEFKFR